MDECQGAQNLRLALVDGPGEFTKRVYVVNDTAKQGLQYLGRIGELAWSRPRTAKDMEHCIDFSSDVFGCRVGDWRLRTEQGRKISGEFLEAFQTSSNRNVRSRHARDCRRPSASSSVGLPTVHEAVLLSLHDIVAASHERPISPPSQSSSRTPPFGLPDTQVFDARAERPDLLLHRSLKLFRLLA